VLLALVVVYAATMLVPLYQNSIASDFFTFYYPAAQQFVTGGNPYSISFYVQPPALLLVFAPFTALPVETARLLWLLAESVMFAAGIAATVRVLKLRLTELRSVFVLIVYLSPNVIWGLMIGQSVVLIFALQALGMWLLHSGRPFWGGFALGAVVLKPHLLAVQLPLLLSAPKKAWLGAATSIALLLLGPELAGIRLMEQFIIKLLPEVNEERYNKLNPADMFVHFLGAPAWLRGIGWAVLALMAVLYAWLMWRVWRERRAEDAPWELTPAVQQGMLAAFLWLPYTLAYDMILVVGSYLWLFKVRGYQLDRPLTWSLGLLWLLPIITLVLHAAGVPTTLNPLLIISLLILVWRSEARLADAPRPAALPT
jgi:hypothetical protein